MRWEGWKGREARIAALFTFAGLRDVMGAAGLPHFTLWNSLIITFSFVPDGTTKNELGVDDTEAIFRVCYIEEAVVRFHD